MKLDQVMAAAGRYKRAKRVGRGTGSGRGKTCGRGHKGYHSRAGSGKLLGFEGGQNPMLARIPKKGFSNFQFRRDYQVVNVGSLDKFEDGARVDAQALLAARLIRSADKPVKLLGNGDVKKKLTVVVAKCSAAAAKKIAQAGGTVEQT